MFKTILFIVLIAVGVVLAYATTRPDTFELQRMVSIKASPEKVFGLIDHLPSWKEWSPWEGKDPNMKKTASGPESGKGAAVAWDGNWEVGTGRMEIIESEPYSKVVFKLDFEKPLKGTSTSEFVIEPKGDMTEVTWKMAGPQPYIGKVMGVIFNCEKMVGKDFETGLAALKVQAEK